MCISKGAPTPPGEPTPRQKGMDELWALLRENNAIFYGDPGLSSALDDFFKKNNVKRDKPTDKQKGYIKQIEKMIDKPEVVA